MFPFAFFCINLHFLPLEGCFPLGVYKTFGRPGGGWWVTLQVRSRAGGSALGSAVLLLAPSPVWCCLVPSRRGYADDTDFWAVEWPGVLLRPKCAEALPWACRTAWRPQRFPKENGNCDVDKMDPGRKFGL